MWPDRVSYPGPLTYESGALPTVLRGLAYMGTPEHFITKGDNFCDSQFASLEGKAVAELGQLFKEEFAPRGANSLFYELSLPPH